MSYKKAHAPLIRAELLPEHDKYRQANFNSQQSLTPAFIDQNSSNSVIQKLHRLALQLSTTCYCHDILSAEISHDFIFGIEKIRDEL